jgi:hypothetical protein
LCLPALALINDNAALDTWVAAAQAIARTPDNLIVVHKTKRGEEFGLEQPPP